MINGALPYPQQLHARCLQDLFQSKGCLRAGEQPAGGAGHEHPPGAQRAAVAMPPPQPCRELEVRSAWVPGDYLVVSPPVETLSQEL